jgi:hypothetical protein
MRSAVVWCVGMVLCVVGIMVCMHVYVWVMDSTWPYMRMCSALVVCAVCGYAYLRTQPRM